MEAIDDPLDFKNSELQTLDENLRCPICKEFFNTPLILSTCSHSFCAICIRRCLAAEQCCPKCRTSSFESNLHNNYDLDNIVNAWKGTRALLLDLEVKRSESVIVTTMENLQVEQHSHSNDFVETNSKVSTTRRSTRLKKTSDETENSNIATCPVCQQKMPVVVINQHVDRCLDGDSRIPPLPTENTQSSIMTNKKIDPGKKPPRIVYDMYKEKDLKKALRDLDLPDHGDRVQLVWRYKEYVALYNSNMDSDNPKDIKQLLRQLNASEQIQFSNRMSSKRTLPDIDSHKQKYGNEYKNLIDHARKKQKSSASSSATSSNADEDLDIKNIDEANKDTKLSS